MKILISAGAWGAIWAMAGAFFGALQKAGYDPLVLKLLALCPPVLIVLWGTVRGARLIRPGEIAVVGAIFGAILGSLIGAVGLAGSFRLLRYIRLQDKHEPAIRRTSIPSIFD